MTPSFTPSWTLRPDAETLASVRRMCGRLLQHPDVFATAFRANLRAAVPGGPALDPATREAAAQLADTVVRLLAQEPDPDAVESFWASAAGGQAARLPSDTLIAPVIKALVRTVRDVLGDDWSSAAGSQWAGLQLWLVPHLTAAGGLARAASPARPLTADGTAPESWPLAPAATDPDPESRPDRKRRTGLRRSSGGSSEWVP